MHDDFLRSATATASHNIDLTHAEHKDVFSNSGWREKLLGQITLSGKIITLREGVLIKAIREHRPFIIENSPINDKDFDLLMYRLQVERKVLYNGEIIEIDEKAPISTAHKAHTDLPQVPLYNEGELPADKRTNRRIYLNFNNFYECFEKIVIDKKTNEATTSPDGLLAQYQASDIFYITGIIPEYDWEELRATIKEKYPQKNFEFVLAPGAAIVNVKANTEQPAHQTIKSLTELPPTVNTIFTNDTD